MIRVFTDGGARGNPGPAGIGVFMEDDKGNVVYTLGRAIGNTTNNVAEYTAVIAALTFLSENKTLVGKHKVIHFFLDSLLLVSQINGLFKVKSPHLRELIFEVREKEAAISAKIIYTHIRREQNKKADSLVNYALDSM